MNGNLNICYVLFIVIYFCEIEKVSIVSLAPFIPAALTAKNASICFSGNYFVKFFFCRNRKVVGGFEEAKIKFSLQFVRLLK